jgi:hypothetical protein
MPNTNNNQNPTTDQNDKAHDPANKIPIDCIWQSLRHNRRNDDSPSTPPSPSIIQNAKKENTPKDSLTNFVPPSLPKNLPATKTVRINFSQQLAECTDVSSPHPTIPPRQIRLSAPKQVLKHSKSAAAETITVGVIKPMCSRGLKKATRQQSRASAHPRTTTLWTNGWEQRVAGPRTLSRAGGRVMDRILERAVTALNYIGRAGK